MIGETIFFAKKMQNVNQRNPDLFVSNATVTLGDSYNVPSESAPMRHGVTVPLCHISANALAQLQHTR